MTYLILSVLLSATLAILMVIFRGCQLKFWKKFVNSKFINKMDLFFENLFKLLKFKTSGFFKAVKNIIKFISLKVAKFFLFIKKALDTVYKKISKKINKQIDKLYIQKVAKPTSDYLKNIEEYKNEVASKNEKVGF